MSDAHAPRSDAPVTGAALTRESRLHDVATGVETTYDAWLDGCVEAERRPRDECVEQLLNAVARGDVTVVAPPSG